MSSAPQAPARTPGRLAVPLLAAGAALGAAWAGRHAFGALAGLALVLVFLEARRIFGASAAGPDLVAGAGAVAALAYLGATGRVTALPWALGALVVALFVFRILGVEAGVLRIGGTVSDLAATIAGAAVAGLLGAHVLLIRAVPGAGFEGLVAFLVPLVVRDAAEAIVDRFGGRPLLSEIDPRRTWAGVVAGLLGAAGAGALAGWWLDAPFGVVAGALLGAGVGVLAPIGSLAVAGLKRGAGLDARAGYVPGVGGVLDLTAGGLFSAPAFYWALRTLVL